MGGRATAAALVATAALVTAPVATGGTGREQAMATSERTREAVTLMTAFAERTGVDGDRPARRYLWTDAFAVCNLLGLARATGEGHYRTLALGLIAQVHQVLGRHRRDDPRRGWISGLSEDEGAGHPTAGGLRIGKPLPERGPGEPLDADLEWERDGQYFHYLTKWMHALDQAARATGEPRYARWAVELADAAHAAFVRASGDGPLRMHWKMSVDLSRPLVASQGQHDPLDGYVTALQLRATARALPQAGGPALDAAVADYAAMVEPRTLPTIDPLGIGGLLVDAYRLRQLRAGGADGDPALVDALLSAAHAGLSWYAGAGEPQGPADRRLAFRELGLAIGLEAVARMDGDGAEPGVGERLEALRAFLPLGEAIVGFWHRPEHQGVSTWAEHRDINAVMLATALAPAGFLDLPAP